MKTIKVGKGQDYLTINDAIASIVEPTLIILTDEIYREKVVIDKPNVTLDGQNKAKIVYNDYATKIHEDGREYVTFRTYTVLVKAPHVCLMNLTIENDAGEGYVVSQAVALHLYNDDITCINCKLLAHQDTLFIGPFSDDLVERYIDLLPEDERIYNGEYHSKFISCYIAGTVDFIFGGGSSDFVDCTIESLPSRKCTWVVAPDHSKENNHGFHFINCKFISSMIEPIVYLARPWREYGYVTFTNCYLGKHIAPQGFDYWEGTNRHEHCRFVEEYSYGEGAKKDRIYFAKVK